MLNVNNKDTRTTSFVNLKNYVQRNREYFLHHDFFN